MFYSLIIILFPTVYRNLNKNHLVSFSVWKTDEHFLYKVCFLPATLKYTDTRCFPVHHCYPFTETTFFSKITGQFNRLDVIKSLYAVMPVSLLLLELTISV